jgi:polyferredoxin
VWLAAVFGLGGVAVMLGLSRRKGSMVHCAAYCPMGICANVLGRLSPWRVKIDDGCSRCGKCSRLCRYSALTPADLEKGRPGLSCTLCGDCVNACPEGRLHYTFPGLARKAARTAFIVAAVALHAVFLGVARI